MTRALTDTAGINWDSTTVGEAKANIGGVVMPGGRLTLTSGLPVMNATVSGATTVYYTPYRGRQVPIYDGTKFILTDIGGELSQATTDTTKSPAAVAASSVYDVFVWNDAGTIRCTRGKVWTDPTTRADALIFLNGIKVNNVAITNGPAQYQGTWVGTIASNASSTIDWILGGSGAGGVAARLMVWNTYNTKRIHVRITDTTSYTYQTATIRQAGGSAGNQITTVSGCNNDCPKVFYQTSFETAAQAGATVKIGVGHDSTTAFAVGGALFSVPVAVALSGAVSSVYHQAIDEVSEGVHVFTALEVGDGSHANTFNAESNAELAGVFYM